MDAEQITTLHRAAGHANAIAEKCSTITERMDLTDPLYTLRMIGEIGVGLGMVAEAVRDACTELAIEAMTENLPRSGPSNFKTGQLVLITAPDELGVNKLSVEWCRTCYALVPEDFLGDHAKKMHEGSAL